MLPSTFKLAALALIFTGASHAINQGIRDKCSLQCTDIASIPNNVRKNSCGYQNFDPLLGMTFKGLSPQGDSTDWVGIGGKGPTHFKLSVSTTMDSDIFQIEMSGTPRQSNLHVLFHFNTTDGNAFYWLDSNHPICWGPFTSIGKLQNVNVIDAFRAW